MRFAVIATLAALNVAFIFADAVRTFCVPGTRARYLLTTVQWLLAAPALAYPPVAIILFEKIRDQPVWLMLSVVWTVLALHSLIRDDDDNWWRRTRKRLRHALQARRAVPVGASS